MDPNANNAANGVQPNVEAPANPAAATTTNPEVGTQQGDGGSTTSPDSSNGGLQFTPEQLKYIESQGGLDKVIAANQTIRNEGRNQNPQDTSNAQDIIQQVQAEDVNSQNGTQPNTPVVSPAAPSVQTQPADSKPTVPQGYMSQAQAAAYGVLRGMAQDYPEISDKLTTGSILLDMKALGLKAFDANGNFNYSAVNTFAAREHELATLRKSAQAAPAAPQPEVQPQKLSDLTSIPAGQMTKTQALNIMVASLEAEKAGEPKHPDYERAVKVARGQQDA